MLRILLVFLLNSYLFSQTYNSENNAVNLSKSLAITLNNIDDFVSYISNTSFDKRDEAFNLFKKALDSLEDLDNINSDSYFTSKEISIFREGFSSDDTTKYYFTSKEIDIAVINAKTRLQIISSLHFIEQLDYDRDRSLEGESVNKVNSAFDRKFNKSYIQFLEDLYSDVLNNSNQSTFAKDVEIAAELDSPMSEIIFEDKLGIRSDRKFFGKTAVLISIADQIYNYYIYTHNKSKKTIWTHKQLNYFLSYEFRASLTGEDCNPACQVNLIHMIETNKVEPGFFESKFVDLLSTLDLFSDSNINYLSEDERFLLIENIVNILQGRYSNQDPFYDIDSMEDVKFPEIGYAKYIDKAINKDDFMTITNMYLSYLSSELAFDKFQDNYADKAVQYLKTSLDYRSKIDIEDITRLHNDRNYILGDYLIMYENQGLTKFLLLFSLDPSADTFNQILNEEYNSEAINELALIAENANIDPLDISDFKSSVIVLSVFSDLLSEAMVLSQGDMTKNISMGGFFEYHSKIIKRFRPFISKEEAISAADLVMINLGSMNNYFELNNKKDVKKAMDLFESQINTLSDSPSSYMNYVIFLLANIEKVKLVIPSKKEQMKQIQDIARKGIFNTLENVSVKDIQNDITFYSKHILLIKFYGRMSSFDTTKTDKFWNDPTYEDVLRDLNISDRIKHVLLEKNNEQLAINYFLDNLDDNSIVEATIAYDVVMYYDSFDETGGGNEGSFSTFIIQHDPEEGTSLYRNDIQLDVSNAPFLYDSSYGGRDGSLHDKILLFRSRLSNNLDTSLLQKEFYNLLIKQSYDYITKDLDKFLYSGKLMNMLIVNDTSTDLIPFDALIDDNSKYLMESYVISYSRSLKQTSDQFINNINTYDNLKSSKDFNLDSKNTVIFGDIDYSDFNSISNLEFSKDELNGIQRQLRKSTIYKSSLASETTFKNLDFSEVNYLHFSVHGTSDKNNYKNSSLILKNDDKNDGFLTFDEVADIDLSNIKIVFLSACDTNVGESFASIGALSLQDAFILAGSESVVSTLWPVDDAATALFSQLYIQSANSEGGIGEGIKYSPSMLNEAKKTFMRSYPEFSSPYYWAGFVNYGF